MCGNGETTRTEGGSRIVLATRGFNSKHQCSILQVSISILEACEFNFAILEETRGRTALSSSARSASKGRRTQHLDLVSVFGLRLQDFFFIIFAHMSHIMGLFGPLKSARRACMGWLCGAGRYRVSGGTDR